MKDCLLEILSTFLDFYGIFFLHLFGFRKIWAFLRDARLFPVSNCSPFAPLSHLLSPKRGGLLSAGKNSAFVSFALATISS